MARHGLRREDGQIIVFVALSMALVMILAAIVVDASHAFVEKHSLQNAVDAASLAAASGLAADGSLTCNSQTMSDATACANVETLAEQYLALNGYPGIILQPCDPSGPVSPCYMTPYKGKTLVYIKLTQNVPTFFGGIIGVPTIGIGASAAASAHASTSTSISTGATTDPSTIYTTISGTTVPPSVSNGTTRADVIIAGTTRAPTRPSRHDDRRHDVPGRIIPGSTIPATTLTTTVTSTGTLTTSSVSSSTSVPPRAGFAQALFAYTHLGTDACSTTGGITVSGNPSRTTSRAP